MAGTWMQELLQSSGVLLTGLHSLISFTSPGMAQPTTGWTLPALSW